MYTVWYVMKYCDERVCLFVVCLSVCWHVQTSRCYLWSWLGALLTTVQYVMYFRFCGWCHFLQIMGQIEIQAIGELFTAICRKGEVCCRRPPCVANVTLRLLLQNVERTHFFWAQQCWR